MQIQINIPDEIAAVIDRETKKMMGQQEMDADGNVIQRRLFPNGIRDWVRAAIRQNAQDLARRNPTEFPAIKAIQDEQRAKQKEWEAALETAFDPTIANP